MKHYIGITSNLEIIKHKIQDKYSCIESMTETGPFLDKKDAAKWLEFMLTKKINYENITDNEKSEAVKPWWGYTFTTP